ncbi:bud site selection protein, partial [Lambiella insularis]|nr:bud site selection protein [Lambiella insularis]
MPDIMPEASNIHQLTKVHIRLPETITEGPEAILGKMLIDTEGQLRIIPARHMGIHLAGPIIMDQQVVQATIESPSVGVHPSEILLRTPIVDVDMNAGTPEYDYYTPAHAARKGHPSPHRPQSPIYEIAVPKHLRSPSPPSRNPFVHTRASTVASYPDRDYDVEERVPKGYRSPPRSPQYSPPRRSYTSPPSPGFSPPRRSYTSCTSPPSPPLRGRYPDSPSPSPPSQPRNRNRYPSDDRGYDTETRVPRGDAGGRSAQRAQRGRRYTGGKGGGRDGGRGERYEGGDGGREENPVPEVEEPDDPWYTPPKNGNIPLTGW